jgi:hypothetical protein
MGFDRLSNFIIKNLNYKHGFIIDEIKRKVLGNHILLDLNFIIYNQLFELEEEINNIIKIILNFQFNYTSDNNSDRKLQSIFELPWWKKNCTNIEHIFNCDNDEEIITKLNVFLNTKCKNTTGENNIADLTKVDMIVIDKIIYVVSNIIETYHINTHIATLGFFIDGIPSFSKIIEQRRRRTKKYFESLIRKEQINNIFHNIKNSYVEKDNIKFNYNKWLKYRYSLDKSFSPISPVIVKLEKELYKHFKTNDNNVYISSGSINGESDFKLFQYIQKENLSGDIAIHTTDSDLIHLILVQQVYFILSNKSINLSVIKHINKNDKVSQHIESNKTNRHSEHDSIRNSDNILPSDYYNYSNVDESSLLSNDKVLFDETNYVLFMKTSQYYDGPTMVNSIIKLYNEITKNNTTDYCIVYDLCMLLFFFGNDHLPSSCEFGPELGINEIFYLYSKINSRIVSLNNDIIEINFDAFKSFLIEISKNNEQNFTKILLSRYFKLTPPIISFLTDYDKMNLNFNEILDFIKEILIQDGLKIKDKLDKDDIRYKLINDSSDSQTDSQTEYDLSNTTILSEYKSSFVSKLTRNKNYIVTNLPIIIEQLLNMLDFSSTKYNGLVSFYKQQSITTENYQNLYNILIDSIKTELITKNTNLYEPLKEDYINALHHTYDRNNVYDYMKKMFHLTTIFFGNLTKYHTNNITSYASNFVPNIKHIIKYLDENNDIEQWKKEINEENLPDNKYFNSINHYVYISPFLNLDGIKDESIKNITKALDIDMLWIKTKQIKDFQYNNVPALKFLNEWENVMCENKLITES